LYRKIVKILHPDLNPDLTEAQKELFYHAVAAYESGDLQTLQVICEMLSDPEDLDCSETTMVRLAHEKERLRKLLNALLEEIGQIKSQFPFTVKELLQSPEKIAARKAELNELIEQYRVMISMYKAKINEMLR
jgi:methyl-accepting chemotaxis protein